MSSQELWKFTFPRKRNLEGRCIYITKEILSRWGKMCLTLQGIGTSMDTRIIARFRKTYLITSFIQESADKHIPSKTSRSVSSVPWITPEIKWKNRRRNKTQAKAKKTGSSKLRSKFETLRGEIKADVKSSMICMSVTWLVALRLIPETSIDTLMVKRKTHKVPHPLRGEMVTVLLNRNWNRQMHLMVSLRMSTAKSRSQIGRLLSWMILLFRL